MQNRKKENNMRIKFFITKKKAIDGGFFKDIFVIFCLKINSSYGILRLAHVASEFFYRHITDKQ